MRVKERIITVPGQAIGQGSGPRTFVTGGGGAPTRFLLPGAGQAGGKFDPWGQAGQGEI